MNGRTHEVSSDWREYSGLELDLAGKAPGLYIIQVNTKTDLYKFRIMKL
jgi:hypothetical protein